MAIDKGPELLSCLHKLKVRTVAYSGMVAFALVDSIFRRNKMHGLDYGPKLSITTWMYQYITEDEFDELFPTQESHGPKQK